jgi:hypothetical protein
MRILIRNTGHCGQRSHNFWYFGQYEYPEFSLHSVERDTVHLIHPNLDRPALNADPDSVFQNDADPMGSGSTTLLLGRIVQSSYKKNRPEAQVETEFVEVGQLFKVFDDPKEKQV